MTENNQYVEKNDEVTLRNFLELYYKEGGMYSNTLRDVLGIADNLGIDPETLSDEKSWKDYIKQFK